jgi:hypothetical protein
LSCGDTRDWHRHQITSGNQQLTDLEIDILRGQLGNHPKYVFTYIARGKKGGKGRQWPWR